MRVVIPFRAGGKSRLPAEIRVDVALAMLGDVVEAAVEVGDTRVVTDDPAGRLVAVGLGAEPIDDPGGGQGAAVAEALSGAEEICLVVNADVPRVRPSDLNALALPPGVIGNPQPFPRCTLAQLGERPEESECPQDAQVGVSEIKLSASVSPAQRLRNLVEDVDTVADLQRIGPHGGRRTRAMMEAIAR